MSWHICMRRSFGSLFNHLVLSLRRLSACSSLQRESFRFCLYSCPDYCRKLNSQTTIVAHHLPDALDLSSDCLVPSAPGSSSTSSHPSLNLVHHSKTRERNIGSFSYTCRSNPSVSDSFFPIVSKTLFVRCSVLTALGHETCI